MDFKKGWTFSYKMLFRKLWPKNPLKTLWDENEILPLKCFFKDWSSIRNFGLDTLFMNIKMKFWPKTTYLRAKNGVLACKTLLREMKIKFRGLKTLIRPNCVAFSEKPTINIRVRIRWNFLKYHVEKHPIPTTRK